MSLRNMKLGPLHRHHQPLKREGRWGIADDFATSFLQFSLYNFVQQRL